MHTLWVINSTAQGLPVRKFSTHREILTHGDVYKDNNCRTICHCKERRKNECHSVGKWINHDLFI